MKKDEFGSRLTRFLLIWIAVVGVLLCIPGFAMAQADPIGEKIKAISIDSSNEWTIVKLDFDNAIPEYTLHFEKGSPKLVLIMIGTKIPEDVLKGETPVDRFPLWKVTPYQGSVNSSLTLYIAYSCEYLIGKTEKSLLLKFPRCMSYSREIEIGEGVLWRTEGKEIADRPLRYDWLVIPKSSEVKLAVESASSLNRSRRTMELTEMCSATGAIAAVNAGFFNGQGYPVSTLVEDGLFVTSGRYPSRPMLLLLRDGSIRLGRFTVRPELVIGGKVIPLNGLNVPISDSATVVYNWNYPFENIPLSGFVYLLKGGRLTPELEGIRELSGSDEYYIVTTLMPEANPLSNVSPDTPVEVRTRIYDRATGKMLDVEDAVGGAPMLVKDGKINVSITEDFVREDISKNPRARTAIAILKDGTILLVVVSEVRDTFYKGVKLEELAKWLLAKGAVDAFNLDGGGSSQLVIEGALVNPYQGSPRKVHNGIFLVPTN